MIARTIKAPMWKYWVLLLILLSVTIGLAFIFFEEDALKEKTVSAVFFFLMLVLIIFSINMYATNGVPSLTIDNDGLTIINGTNLLKGNVPWHDIEGFGIHKIKLTKYVTIRLKSYNSLVKGMSDSEIRKMLRIVKIAKMGVYAAAIAGASDGQTDASVFDHLPHSKELKQYGDYLHGQRQRYGGEILLGWNLRDRSAKKFLSYLEELRLKNVSS